MPLRYLDNIRPKSRLGVWIWSPVIVLRVALFAVYAVYVYGAVIAFIAGIPIFTLTAPEGYTSAWAIALAISALLSAIGATSDHWQKLEKWSTLVLSALMLGYVGGVNLVGFLEMDLDRQFAGAIAIIAVILPVTRFIYLAAQSGKKRLIDVIDAG